jgi:hypothetical protein
MLTERIRGGASTLYRGVKLGTFGFVPPFSIARA